MNSINKALIMLSKRAESYDKEHLFNTFVDYGSFYFVLSNPDHQVMYGRRGTGKTHALSYLCNMKEKEDNVMVFIDMRTIGSTGGIYSDTSIPLKERSTRLLIDTLEQVHYQILQTVIQKEGYNLSSIGPLLDELANAITSVHVEGPIEQILTQERVSEKVHNESLDVSILDPQLSIGIGAAEKESIERGNSIKRSGIERHRVHFGSVQKALAGIAEIIRPKRIWIILDEWSEVPIDIQPILADLIRRSILPIRNITVKISAIEQRSYFRVQENDSNYIGIELGADITTSVNLDDYMVFDNNPDRAKEFFLNMFYMHLKSMSNDSGLEIHSKNELIKTGFSNIIAFAELVRAAEGVPRDAINIVGIAAQKADESQITVPDIRSAAKTWYTRAKEPAIHREDTKAFLRYVVDEVIGQRKAKAFLLRSDQKVKLMEELFDARVLHIIKKGVSSKDQPGIRYDVWAIDYGCYVDLINTASEPEGLFQIENEDGIEYIQVPVTDYRSIRRAVLNLSDMKELKLI